MVDTAAVAAAAEGGQGGDPQEQKEEGQQHELNDIWTYYFHDPNDASWTLSSYQRLGDVATVEEFWGLHNLLRPHLHLGMFFLMREHVFPCWDDPYNKDGGCVCIKVLKEDLPAVWEWLSMQLLGESIIGHEGKKNTAWDHVNGLSSSPKRHFCIVKIWLKSAELQVADLCLDASLRRHSDILFKLNQETIQNQGGGGSSRSSAAQGTA